MKKHLILMTLLVIGATVNSFAQMKFQMGIKGGVNFASLQSDTNYDNRTGYNAGAFISFKFAKLAIQPEVIFSNQGAVNTIDIEGLESEFNYINVPIIIKSYIVGGLNLQLGPQFSFLTSARQQVINGLEEDIKSQLNDTDIALALGLGIDLPLGFTIDARYNLGLNEIDDQESFGAAKNQVYQISIGYKFIGLGKNK